MLDDVFGERKCVDDQWAVSALNAKDTANSSQIEDYAGDSLVNFRDLLFESDSEPEDEISGDESEPFYKHQLFFHELETAARIKGLVHCISNDLKLSQSVEAMCINQKLCKYEQLQIINEENYPGIFKACSVSYSQVYQSLRTAVCDQLTLQLKSVKDKLQNFIAFRGSGDPELGNALTNIESLLCLTNEEREDKFEENNYSTTTWLESAESIVKLIRLSLTSSLPSSDSETDEDDDIVDKGNSDPEDEEETSKLRVSKTATEEVISELKDESLDIDNLEQSTSKTRIESSKGTIRVASFAIDPVLEHSREKEMTIIQNVMPIKSNSTHFQNYPHEIKSTYYINNWGNIKKPEKYHIFTSVPGVKTENAILIKLFIHNDNLVNISEFNDPLDWANATMILVQQKSLQNMWK